MSIEYFSVDAQLLRELGERLVGRPHMALAELIKNSYDADARCVEIRFAPDRIKIIDDGHGMSRTDFSQRWMRIGTPHKQRARHSPELGRGYTGSKGVGRLAAQLLARRLTLKTVALSDPTLAGLERRRNAMGKDLLPEVNAVVDWDLAVEQDKLTEVPVEIATRQSQVTRFANDSACGTQIVLEGLTARWTADRFRRLAQEIWALQPPLDIDEESEDRFSVKLVSRYSNVVDEFDGQMRAIFDIWTARVTGRLLDPGEAEEPVSFTLAGNIDASEEDQVDEDGTGDVATGDNVDEPDSGSDAGPPTTDYPDRLLSVEIQLRGSKPRTFLVRVPECSVSSVRYEILLFDLANRQPKGVKVPLAREYLRRFGGVGIFDAGFRLPYYGADVDWLGIERDHARRLSRSNLVPDSLKVRNGLQDLPTNGRIYGSASISTAGEAEALAVLGLPVSDALTIQVTRDRLVDNAGYQQLRHIVRLGLDLYAMESARAKLNRTRSRRVSAAPATRFSGVRDLVESVRERLPEVEYNAIVDGLDEAIADSRALEESARAHASLLGALATAGMTSLAFEHDMAKQRATVREIVKRLLRLSKRISDPDIAQSIRQEATRLANWVERAQRMSSLFKPLADQETRDTIARFPAAELVPDVVEQMEVLGRGTQVATEIPANLTLPMGGYAAWSAVIQNVLVNAFNATLEQPTREVVVRGEVAAPWAALYFDDTGIGVDLEDADRLFEPFERGLEPDARRAALGLGGTGLGLAIVRMIADELGVTVGFEAAPEGFATRFAIRWREVG